MGHVTMGQHLIPLLLACSSEMLRRRGRVYRHNLTLTRPTLLPFPPFSQLQPLLPSIMREDHVTEHPPESSTTASHLFDSLDSGGVADDPFAQFGSEQDDSASQPQLQDEEYPVDLQAVTEGETKTSITELEENEAPTPANVLEKQTEEKIAYIPKEFEEDQSGAKTLEGIGERQENSVISPPVQVASLFGSVGDGSGEDLFAQLAGSEKDELTQLEESQEVSKSDGVVQSEGRGRREVPMLPEEKDYSDLLAEFEADNGMLEPAIEESAESHSESKAEKPQSLLGQSDTENDQAPAVSSLFTDDLNDTVFDKIVPEADSEPQEASLATTAGTSTNPFIQGLFTDDATDFLNQGQIITEVQESGDSGGKMDQSGAEPLEFDIPQGWYDDDGQWQWYTEEEKEQVKFAMMGSTGWEETEQGPAPVTAGLGAST